MEKVRILLEFPEDQIKKIDRIMEKTNIKTRKEYFNNALTLLEWAIEVRERQEIVASVNRKAGQFSELRMPIFSNIRVNIEENNRDNSLKETEVVSVKLRNMAGAV
jgi:hypothetical protein